MTGLRLPALVLVALLAGVLVGSGLGGLAHAPPNDACLDFGGRAEERSVWTGKVELWPLGLRCEYLGPREPRTKSFAPSFGELAAWIALATLLAVAALRMRRSAPVRGAAAAVALLALVGAAWQWGGFSAAFQAALGLGTPLVFALDLRLRPADLRSVLGAGLTAAALVPTVFVAAVFLNVAGLEIASISVGLLAGGAVAAGVARWEAPRGEPLPSH
jgi:hypothetical protein